MVDKTTVDITPDKSLIQKLGMTGYRTEQAISELIDNSIDARTPGRMERIDITLDFGRKTISVADDGMGMGIDEVKNGLTIAKGTKLETDTLGKYGLGMKSACSTLGKSFTILTSKENSDTEYFVSYDEDDWLADAEKTWEHFPIEIRKKPRPWHGTIINISNPKIVLYANQVSAFRKSFGIRYGEYLKSGQVSIFINTRECKPISPSLESDKKEIIIDLTNHKRIHGWIGLLEKRSIKGDYGIHLYKHGRLIKAYDKFGIRHHPEVAKIVGELNLDHVPVNFHKTGFIEDSLEYKEALESFKTNPIVIEVLRSSIPKDTSNASVESIINYFNDETKRGIIKPRISSAKSKLILEKATKFNIQKEKEQFEFIFEDGKEDDLYRIEHITPILYRIIINRNSPIFEIVSNPLFLIGLIEVEVKAVLQNLTEYGEFVKERNMLWNNFVKHWTAEKIPEKLDLKRKEAGATILPGYQLVRELADLHDFLKDKFEYGFQFTGLCTLAPFLNNAYNKTVYTIHTESGTGEILRDLINGFTKGEIGVLVEAKSNELKTALNLSEKTKFIIIREYKKKFVDTWAKPADAWLDLLQEYKRNCQPISEEEFGYVFDYLLDNNILKRQKLISSAKHRNMLFDLEEYFGGELE